MICYEDRTFMNDAQELISENNENQFSVMVLCPMMLL